MCAMLERDFSFINDALEIDLDDGQITVHVVKDTKEKPNNDKFVPKIENLSNNNLNHNELPSYSSLDFVADEPPKYEVVTGKKLSHGTVSSASFRALLVLHHCPDIESVSSLTLSKLHHYLVFVVFVNGYCPGSFGAY
ncbi:uncharacterized protein LOC124814407 isoform X3 [Hydra vulgaris]|uniref:Uncharacterized protein LOC124814407 isoform X3 n=1 Tax=Hydra vulgaris TaxID=6087 RepID=A0ABM4C3T1_HYDVU